jgi:hypothetical protein
MFTGSNGDWVEDVKALAELGVGAVDFRLFGYGPDQGLNTAIDNMRRFHDGVLAKL